MKKLLDYLKEAEFAAENPVAGDVFAINIREECLVETVVLEHDANGVVIAADDGMLAIFESYGITMENVCMECGMAEGECSHVQEQYADSDRADERPRADPGEYDHEGDMAKTELHTIVRAARKLLGILDNEDNMPEWTQKKITKAADYVDTAADYIQSQQERGISEQSQDSSPVARAVLRRILMQHSGLLAAHGPERVMAAVDELADRVGDVEEIGSSDVSGWVRDVMRKLSDGPDTSMEEGYVVTRGIDTERYQARDGLEGPFSAKNGKVVYYDKREGKYYDPDTDMYIEHDEWQAMNEAEYQGRDVPLGKPMKGDVAKSKVYVRDPKTGNVKKVNFGDPNMKIKKSNPARRKSFRARHNCDNPGPRTRARYWSCRAW